MKVRNGFVSNSSSSSFILVLDKEPESADELREILFPDGDEVWYNDWGDSYVTEALATRVFEDFEPAALEGIASEFSSFFYTNLDIVKLERPEWPSVQYGAANYRHSWDKYYKEMKEYSETIAINFVMKYKDKKLYYVNYDDSSDSFLESGCAFENIGHVKFSHH